MNARFACALVLILLLDPPSVPAQGRRNSEVTVLLKLERQLGKPLTFEQRKRVEEATDEMQAALQEARQALGRDLAEITGLPEETLQAMLSPGGQGGSGGRQILGQVEAKLGRKLNGEELQQVREAEQGRREASLPAREKYIQTLAEATGLSVEVIDGLIPQPGGGERQRGQQESEG